MKQPLWPKVEDYALLEDYEEAVKAYYDDTEIEKIDVYWHWSDMMGKCYDPDHKDYPTVGTKGIKVCDRWRTVKRGRYEGFLNFFSDVGPVPTE